MSQEKSTFQELMSELRRQRDEIRLKIHLGKVEARDEWERLEARWQQLLDEYQPVREAVEESAEAVWQGLKLTAGELKSGFERIRKSL